MQRTRYYIAPRMHGLLSAVAASQRHTVTFHCNTASAHATALRGCTVGGASVLPAAALLDLGCGASLALSDRETSTSLTRLVLPQLLPAADLPPALELRIEAGAMEVTETLVGVTLFRATVSRLYHPSAPAPAGPRPRQRVTTLQRIMRAGFGASWAATLRRAALTSVDSPGSEQADGFVTHPGMLASAIMAADAAEDASLTAGTAIAVACFVVEPPAVKDAGLRVWTRGDTSGRSDLTQASRTIAMLEVLISSPLDSMYMRWMIYRMLAVLITDMERMRILPRHNPVMPLPPQGVQGKKLHLAAGAPRPAGQHAHAELIYEMQWQASHTERDSLAKITLTGASRHQEVLEHKPQLCGLVSDPVLRAVSMR